MSCTLISLLFFFPVTLKEIFCFGHGTFEKPINHLSRDVEEAAGYTSLKIRERSGLGIKNLNLTELHEITQKKNTGREKQRTRNYFK